jgi:membrane protease YdiL (CAAX protease family)
MKKTTSLKSVCVAVPYAAVIIGLYILKNAWITIGLYHIPIALFLIGGDRKGLLKKIRTGSNCKIAAVSIILAAMIFPIIFFCWRYMQLESVHLNTALADFGLHGASWFFFMIYFSIIQPFLEELYWRGYLQSNHRYFSWADFAFAGYHMLVLGLFIKPAWLVIAFIVLTGAARVWRYIAYKLQGLAVPLLSHVAADISIVAVTNILIR